MNNKDRYTKILKKYKQWYILDLIIILIYLYGFYISVIFHHVIFGLGISLIGISIQLIKNIEMMDRLK